MTEDRPEPPQRQTITPEPQFASILEFQGLLILHALAAGIIGVLGWMVTIGFGVMGADGIATFYAIHLFYLVVFGMTHDPSIEPLGDDPLAVAPRAG